MGLCGLIDNEDRYAIVNCAEENQMSACLEEKPASLLIINDINVGKELISDIRKKNSDLPILLIADTINPSGVLKTINSGIQGFLTKECDGDEIIHAIHALIKGERFFCNNVLNILLNKDAIEAEDCSPTSLTERETEIIKEIVNGLTSKEVGEKLFISAHTVQTHRKNIMRKLKVGSVSELILYAIRTGLVEASG
jgi:DNA-binding NarL/FixJ family response regulator